MTSKSPGKVPKSGALRSEGTSTRSSSDVSSLSSSSGSTSHSRSSERGDHTQRIHKPTKNMSKNHELRNKSSSGICLEKVETPSDDIFTIDLTDPDDLMRKMDMLDLTEEETEDLIKQAYDINRRLKMELQEREMPEQLSRYYTISAPCGLSRSNTSVGRNLPPLEHRGRHHVNQTSHLPTVYAQLNSKEYGSSSSSLGSRSAGSTRGKSKPTKKPEWNDRFSYT